MTKHYKFGSSTASRTINCSAWRNYADKVPPQEASVAAMEGTAMHKVFEDCLNNADLCVDDFIGQVVEGVELTADMVDLVYTGLLLQDDMTQDYGLEIHTEVTMEHSPEVGGTADIVGWNQAQDVIAVGDLKTGGGVIVQAKNNSQLLFCASLAIDHFKLYDWVTATTKVLLYIIQPVDRREDKLDVWETDIKTVMQFWDKFEAAVKAARQPDIMPVAGRHCKFCPATAVCPAKTGQIAAAMRLKADSKELDVLTRAMGMVDEVEQWCRAVRKMAHEQAERGVRIAGWKLVNKRATRQWAESEASVLKRLNKLGLDDSQVHETKLLTPAKIERVFKQKEIDFSLMKDYIESRSSGTTLAHSEDKRPEALPQSAIAAKLSQLL